MSMNNLKTRLSYHGGARQIDRMIEDKQRSLNKALLYSYQSATAVLKMNGDKEFRCLINPNKLSMELDDKVLSIPFEDICLNAEKPEGATTSSGKIPTNVKCGDVIEWKENGTYWIIYSQYLQETAYFRGQMRQCEKEPITIGNKKFWYYLKGPDEKGIDWQKSKHFILNDLNYSIEIYISNTTETKQLFQRFKKLNIPFKNSEGKVDYRPFEVQAVDDISTDGILVAYLKEDFTNEWDSPVVEIPEEKVEQEAQPEVAMFKTRRAPIATPEIHGPTKVYPYDIVQYEVFNGASGAWSLSNKRAVIREQNSSYATVEITSGKSGSVSLIYKADGFEDVIFNIEILSL